MSMKLKKKIKHEIEVEPSIFIVGNLSYLVIRLTRR